MEAKEKRANAAPTNRDVFEQAIRKLNEVYDKNIVWYVKEGITRINIFDNKRCANVWKIWIEVTSQKCTNRAILKA